jgi:hypothetical protein
VIDLDWLRDRLVMVLRGRRIWEIFVDLNSTRAIGFTPCPITYAEICAYSRLARAPIRPFEMKIILDLDRVYLEHANKRSSKDQEQTVSTRPMSGALFDALFVRGKKVEISTD